jgi:hypothetical protein
MKTATHRLTATALLIFAVTLLLAVASGAFGRSSRHRSAPGAQQQAGPVLPGTAYSDLLNGLSAAGGR